MRKVALPSITILAIFLIIFSCQNDSSTSTKDRPLSPWVFRSVLDGNPRMITLALNDKFWASYHTVTGAIYKAWRGDVNFSGAVYDMSHGPQPISQGSDYFISENATPWKLLDNGFDTKTEIQFKGHAIENGSAVLLYALDNVQIRETVEATENDQGQLIFERSFDISGLKDIQDLVLSGTVGPLVLNTNLSSNGDLKITKENKIKSQNAELFSLDYELHIEDNGVTSLNAILSQNGLTENPNNIKEEAGAVTSGAKLIAKSDCKTCHNKKVKTIGPAYVSVAAKYKTTAANREYLITKVKNGGSGVWGNQIMNAHHDLPNDDIGAMVDYILGLDADDDQGMGDGNEQESTELSYVSSIEDIGNTPILPGSVVKIFKVSPKDQVLPNNSTKKPIYAGILGNFDNITGDDWKELTDFFGLEGRGYLHVPKKGVYTFRVWSDDGSRVTLNNEVILDNDGLHGNEFKEVMLALEEGYHPYLVEFFQGAGGKYLSWNWKKPGDVNFEVIPTENLYYKIEDQDQVKGYKLPMATTTSVPGDGSALLETHPSFDLFQARPSTFTPKVGGLDFMSDGRVVISTWDATGSVYILDNVKAENPDDIIVKKVAEGLAEPLGLKIVDDEIYIMQKQEMTHLVDTNGDEIIDEYRTLCNAWGVTNNFHEFGFGLAYKDGYFYATLATGILPGGAGMPNQHPDRGSVIKVSKEDGSFEIMANGLRTPNGIGFGYNDELYVADNQGDWLPSSKIIHITDGDWFGSRAVDFEGTADFVEKKPVVWLPQDEIGNSPSTPAAINVGPYKSQMIHGEVTHGGVKRVFVEEVEGVYQGALFRFIQGLEAGVNRLAWSPDGDLYVGGIGNSGNWAQTGKLWYGLQRLSYNDNPTFEMLAIRAHSNGMEIEFTEPLAIGQGWNPKGYAVQQWYYEPTAEYGGPKLGKESLNVKSASVSEDRKKVFLEFEGMKEDHVVYIKIEDQLISQEGNGLWSTESWYTLNKIPQNKIGEIKQAPFEFKDNHLTQLEKDAGWQLLFDGETTNGWRNYRKQTIGSSWKVEDGALYLDATKKPDGGWQAADGGDIITDKSYKNYELKLDWKISACGNSGIIYNVVENDKYDYVWQTGPEMQILDNTCHPDTKYPTHRAGDLYDMIECKYKTVNPAGDWNKVRIKSLDGHMQFYLNGHKVVEFTMHTPEWDELIKNSKFYGWDGFGVAKEGHIALQDHGDPVYFKNIMIREL